ncbi:MAG: hypothetical protein CMJ64_21855 [Planctomycetaceae bacterium]|nr:hypothetical protein [Planctomycetaceae bacterium]
MAAEYYIAFWNVENLFSTKTDPDRSEKLQRASVAATVPGTCSRPDPICRTGNCDLAEQSPSSACRPGELFEPLRV